MHAEHTQALFLQPPSPPTDKHLVDLAVRRWKMQGKSAMQGSPVSGLGSASSVAPPWALLGNSCVCLPKHSNFVTPLAFCPLPTLQHLPPQQISI